MAIQRVPPDVIHRTDLYARGLGGATVGHLDEGAFVSVGYRVLVGDFTGTALASSLRFLRELKALSNRPCR